MGRMQPGTITGFIPPGLIVVAIDGDTRMGPFPFMPSKVRFLPDPPKERIWRDASGSFEISATLVATNATSVSLKKSDGETITVPIDKLSKRDQDYVKEQRLPTSDQGAKPSQSSRSGMRGGMPGMLDVPNGRGGLEPGPTKGGRPTGSVEKGDINEYNALPAGDMSAVETIAVADPSAPWSYTPLPTPSFAPSSLVPVEIPMGEIRNRGTARLVVSCDGSAAALGIGDPFDERTEFHVVDSKSSQLLASMELPSKSFAPSDITPGARYVITASSKGGQPQHVAFWKPSNGSLERVGGWRTPSAPADGLSDVRFIGLERAVTIDGSGKLILWTLGDGKALATCQVDRKCGRAFSFDGRRMAALLGGEVHLLDLAAGRDLAAFTVEGSPPQKLGFSLSGAKLAGLSTKQVVVWDLTTGKLVRSIELKETPQRMSVDWLDDRYVLVARSRVVDTELGVTFWAFSTEQFVDAVSIAPAGNLGYFYKDMERSGLFSCRLPVDTMAQRWDAFDKSTLVKVEAGPVSIQMQGLPFSDSEQQQIREALTEQLEKSGFTVEANASMKLTLRVERGKTQQGEVRELGKGLFDASDATISYTPTSSEIKLTIGERVLWKQSGFDSPVGHFDKREDETYQQAVDRHCRPRAAFFVGAELPRPGLLLPDAKPNLGGWRLTGKGLLQ